ncbi:hypothetical protein SAMN02745883_00719 [Caminicella sporogenes DSM 14501]|uniref:Uncharacterized protein n=1 Tax=Caminicella sporogenes DSM 14501 TaxID=1121266 RepID=A0A1M6MZC0_9FIRM|nr:hypothetical protein SAMN02745883_00719 [Caminicella sporogenes DSM 14501]
MQRPDLIRLERGQAPLRAKKITIKKLSIFSLILVLVLIVIYIHIN